MKLFNRNIFALLAASASLLTSCSDDVLNSGEENKDNYSVTVYVPKSAEGVAEGAGTRGPGSVSDWNGKESQIHSLRLIAYPVKDNKVLDPVSYNLLDPKEVTISSTDDNGYTAYNLSLDNGDYKMYVVANSDVTGTESEGELKLKAATAPTSIQDMETNGITMSCAHSELLVNGSTITNDNLINVSSTGATAKVRANLKFAVSKVRVTLLNDLRITEGVSEVSVNGHSKDSRLFTDNTYKAAVGAKFTPEYAYYDMPTKNPEGLEKSNVDNLKGESTTLPAKEWAWQTVFYVPEKLVQTDADNTHMDYKVGADNHTLPIGEKTGNARKIERSHFYDYVGTPDGKFSLFVEEWDPVTIAGALFGPTYLHIDQTSIDLIEAGQKVPIWYQTNAPSIKPECETFTNQIPGSPSTELPIYTFSYNEAGDTLFIELNKQIDLAEFDAIKNSKKYQYITLVAGTIHKKIEIKDISFEEFINVDPQMITIDVAENKSSGKYTGYFPIKITTNMKTIKLVKFQMDGGVRKQGWPEATIKTNNVTDKVPSLYVTHLDSDGEFKPASFQEDGIAVPEGGEVILWVNYTDLNSNRDLWKSDYDMGLEVKGVRNDNTEDTALVNIYVRAAYDTYRIHFKAPGWSQPHIYVYQCLELPSDHPTHPNKPVGADKDQAGNTAAIEYSFTGKIAFKGWYYADETDPEGKNNNPYNKGSFKNNFWYFDQGSEDGWNTFGSDITNLKKHYFMDYDFCPTHRQNQSCGKCKGSDYARAFPGIGMIKTKSADAPNNENDWWEFELTGVATPGKALIMFADADGTHDYENKPRYPGNNQPGIPLFDFPSKEGWLIYQGADVPIYFTGIEPGASSSNIYTYRIYWPRNASNWQGLNVWQNSTVWGNKLYSSYPKEQSGSWGKYWKYNDSYSCLEFQVEQNKLSGSCKYQKIISSNNYDGAQTTLNFSSFTEESSNVYSYTITNVGAGHGGKP